MNDKKIGNFILELRKEQNMTQEELALQLHVDRGTVSKWERGVYLPKPDLLLELSQLFHVSVNEILLGERKTKENEQKIDKIMVDVMNKSRRKVKKIGFILGLIILLLIFSFGIIFFGTYFAKNYDSISVHHITGGNEKFEIRNTIAVISRDHIYLLVGGIQNPLREKIYRIELYYVKDGEKNFVSSNTGFSPFGPSEFGFKLYEDLNYFKQNLYMDIIYGEDKKTDTIKLRVVKEFSNDTIKYRNNSSITPIPAEEIEYSIPAYMKKYCKLDIDYNQYHCKSEKGKIKIEEQYDYSGELPYTVRENSSGFYLKRYSYSNDVLSYEFYEKDGNDLKEKFQYDFTTHTCDGICKDEVIDYFKKEYLPHIEMK